MRPDELCGNLQNNEYDHYWYDDLGLQPHQPQFQQRDGVELNHATVTMRKRIIERRLFYFFLAIQLIFCKDSFFDWFATKI